MISLVFFNCVPGALLQSLWLSCSSYLALLTLLGWLVDKEAERAIIDLIRNMRLLLFQLVQISEEVPGWTTTGFSCHRWLDAVRKIYISLLISLILISCLIEIILSFLLSLSFDKVLLEIRVLRYLVLFQPLQVRIIRVLVMFFL